MAVSKRRRGQVSRGAQYGVLAVAVALLAVFADWNTIARAFFNIDALGGSIPDIIRVALVNTVIYTALGFGFGLVLGLVLALMRLSTVAPYRWISTVYIEFFRGIPALLVFITFGYGVPLAFNLKFDIYSSVMLSLGLVGAAYMAETIRAGIQAVPRGQVEAARSLGMSSGRAMISIVIPQAFRIILPPLTNELVLLTKDSSLIYILGLSLEQYDLTKFGRDELNQTSSLTPILLAGLCYLIITIPLGFLSRYLERRTGGPKVKVMELSHGTGGAG